VTVRRWGYASIFWLYSTLSRGAGDKKSRYRVIYTFGVVVAIELNYTSTSRHGKRLFGVITTKASAVRVPGVTDAAKRQQIQRYANSVYGRIARGRY
jgi:hypothetical protein